MADHARSYKIALIQSGSSPPAADRAANDPAGSRPLVTWVLAILCTVVAMATLIRPELRAFVGHTANNEFLGLISSPFVHGFSRTSTLPHLAGNLVLLLSVGRWLEQRIGTGTFLMVSVGAYVAFIVIQSFAGFEVNGVSVIIWAFAPPLVAVHWHAGWKSIEKVRVFVMCFLMWVAIPVAMTSIPIAAGYDGGLLSAFMIANLFHLLATLIGALFAVFLTSPARARQK